MKTLALVLVLFAALSGAAIAGVADNPSFEIWEPDAQGPEYFWAVHPDTEFIGYHENITNFSGNSWVFGWYTLYYGLDYCTSLLWKPSDGNRFLRLRNNLSRDDGLYTIAPTTAGTEYTLSFDMAGDLDYPPEIKSLKVELGWWTSDPHIIEYPVWDGTGKVGTGMPHGSDPRWETHSITFTAHSDTFITFSNNTFDDDPAHQNGGPLLDNIRVSPAVPLPEVDIPAAKGYGDGVSLMLRSKVVTATNSQLGGITFYMQEPDRSSGICAEVWSVEGGTVAVGDLVDVSGDIRFVNGEAVLRNAHMIKVGTQSGAVAPLGMTNKCLGGSDFNSLVKGATGGTGVNNVGLLVKLFGTVSSAGAGQFLISDGSGAPIRVDASRVSSLPADDDYVWVVGISRISVVGSDYIPYVQLRADGDWVKTN